MANRGKNFFFTKKKKHSHSPKSSKNWSLQQFQIYRRSQSLPQHLSSKERKKAKRNREKNRVRYKNSLQSCRSLSDSFHRSNIFDDV